MSLTGGGAISLALQEVGRLYPGEVPSTSEQATGLSLLNNMLDNWSLERLNIPVVVVVSHAMVAAQTAYTFGPAGTFTTRYLRLDTVGVINSGIRTPVKVVGQMEFQAIVDKAASSITPTTFYYDYQFPVATGNLWPAPNTTGLLEVGGWQALAEFPDLTTTVGTPAGYDRAIVANLALELASIYTVPSARLDVVLRNANESKAALRAMNASNFGQPAQPPPSGPIDAIPPGAPGQQA